VPIEEKIETPVSKLSKSKTIAAGMKPISAKKQTGPMKM